MYTILYTELQVNFAKSGNSNLMLDEVDISNEGSLDGGGATREVLLLKLLESRVFGLDGND